MNNLTAPELRRALALREKIDQLESELGSLLGGSTPGTTARRVPTPRLNWGGARRRTTLTVAKPARRKMSAAARARIAAAARKRWKNAKAAGKRTLAG